MKIKQ